MLQLRREQIIPRLSEVRSEGVKVLADNAVSARWQLADGRILRIDVNLSEAFVTSEPVPNGAESLYSSGVDPETGMLSPRSVLALLEAGS